MRTLVSLLVAVLVLAGLLTACDEGHQSTVMRPDPVTNLQELTPEEVGQAHNAILAQVESTIPLVTTTHVAAGDAASVLAEASSSVLETEFVKQDFLDFIDYAKAIKDEGVFDFFGPKEYDGKDYLEYLLNNDEITETEYQEHMAILDDTQWALSISSLTTKSAQEGLAVRDASRSFWMARNGLQPEDEFTSLGGMRDAGIVLSDYLGSLAGGAHGAAAMSLYYIICVELAEDGYDMETGGIMPPPL